MNHKKQLHLVLISSPLQLLTATILNLQYLQPQTNIDKILFIEGEQYKEPDKLGLWDKILYGYPARPHIDSIYKNINKNLSMIKEFIHTNSAQHVTLYISDLYWTFNNVIYSYFLHHLPHGNFSCALFDEGSVIYIRDELNYLDRLKSYIYFLKFFLHRIPYTILTNKTHENRNLHIPHLYCMHTVLITQPKRKEKSKNLDINLIVNYLQQNYPVNFDYHHQQKSLLFLFQPFTNILPKNKIDFIIDKMVLHFSNQGIKTFYLKGHHFSPKPWLLELKNKHNFIIWNIDNNLPIEAYAKYSPFENIVAINSSALINLKAFGYEGKLISYGLNIIASSKKQKKFSEKMRKLYDYIDIEVIDLK